MTKEAYPALPPGHPFSGVQSAYYWSSNISMSNTDSAWNVTLVNGTAFSRARYFTRYVWPVRGPE